MFVNCFQSQFVPSERSILYDFALYLKTNEWYIRCGSSGDLYMFLWFSLKPLHAPLFSVSRRGCDRASRSNYLLVFFYCTDNFSRATVTEFRSL